MKLMEKVSKTKIALMCAAPAVVTAVTPIVSRAAEGDTTTTTDAATTALVTAVSGMANSISSAIGSVLPIAIPLVGAGLVVTIGLKQFKRIAGKA